MRFFRLGRRFIFMSILTIFAPFILVYLLMYWFFRSFKVRLSLHMMWQFSLRRTGVLPEPVFNQRSRINTLRPVEVPGVQRASPPVRTTSQGIISRCGYIHGSVSQRKAGDRHRVRSCDIFVRYPSSRNNQIYNVLG